MLRESLRQFFQEQGIERTYWLGCSGGLDSQVLLALCLELRAELSLQLQVIHVNHHLSQHAEVWARQVKETCLRADLKCVLVDVEVDVSGGESLEAVAREQRYKAFATCLKTGDMLLTAHQQDDQAETVLLQLVRGAGPKGLAAMPEVKPFANGWHGRPLLTFSRSQLEAYARKHQFIWADDESNTNLAFARNYIRHEILPLLRSRWPAIAATLSRSAAHCAESQVILEDYALTLLKKVKGSNEATLSVQAVLSLSAPEQRLVLRTWIQSRGFNVPDTKKCAAIQAEVLMAEPDRVPCLTWDGVEVRRFRDDLFIMSPLLPHDEDLVVVWLRSQSLPLLGIGKLSAVAAEGNGLLASITQVEVRFRQGGETLRLAKRGRHTLKKLYQEWHVPPWERDRLPLLFVGDRCVAVVGYGIDEDYTAKANEMGWLPHLES